MTTLLLRFESRVARAALRRMAAHPTRRALWIVVVTVAVLALAFDVVTSGVAPRNFGAWSPHPALAVAAVLGIFAIAALAGRRAPLTYGTRSADAVWWRYAGVETPAGQQATTAILALRAGALVALGAVPVAALFALATPRQAGPVVALALAAIALAPLVVLVSASTAPRTASDRAPRKARPKPVPIAELAAELAPVASTATATRSRVPRGFIAARWLVARRRKSATIPYRRFALGALFGIAATHYAGTAGGQLVSMAIVIGGFALLLDGAMRRTTAPALLLSPWWRSAIGTSSRGIVAWALADATEVALFGAGALVGLGVALGALPLALAVVPAVVLVPVALRLVVLAVDTFFANELDRRGAGAFMRIAAVTTLTIPIVALALAAGERAGAFAAVATATLLLAAVAAAGSRICAARLAATHPDRRRRLRLIRWRASAWSSWAFFGGACMFL